MSHVGSTSLVHVTPELLITLHVRSVSALMMYPGRQLYVATTGFVGSYDNTGTVYVTKPLCGAGRPWHFEAVHVGAGPLHAPVAHTSGVAEERSNPWLHVNVATEPWL